MLSRRNIGAGSRSLLLNVSLLVVGSLITSLSLKASTIKRTGSKS